MICNKCNFLNDESSAFCRNCGAKIKKALPPKEKKAVKASNDKRRNPMRVVVGIAAAVTVCAVVFFAWQIFGNRKDISFEELDHESDSLYIAPIEQPAIGRDNSLLTALSTRLLTADDVRGMSAQELRIWRNTIFARHGRRFASADLQEHFGTQDWYRPRYDDVTHMLNEFERRNVEFIQRHESNPSVGATVNIPRTVVEAPTGFGITQAERNALRIDQIADLQNIANSQLATGQTVFQNAAGRLLVIHFGNPGTRQMSMLVSYDSNGNIIDSIRVFSHHSTNWTHGWVEYVTIIEGNSIRVVMQCQFEDDCMGTGSEYSIASGLNFIYQGSFG